jgi:hypothetical protein
MFAASEFIKRAVPSRGDEESDELSLVAIRDGVNLTSRSKAFRGGSMLAWFGGISVDLTEAELAPDARLSVHTLYGGIDLRVPSHWRIESNAKVLNGGVTLPSSQPSEDAPVLSLDGLAVFGGVAVRD